MAAGSRPGHDRPAPRTGDGGWIEGGRAGRRGGVWPWRPYPRVMETVPPPDPAAEPDGFVVQVDSGERIHFLDWGGLAGGGVGSLLIHGLSNTAWSWAPVARRLRRLA